MDFLQQFISFPMGPSPSGLVGQAPPPLPPPLWVFSPMGATPTEEHALKDYENHFQLPTPTTIATTPFSLSLCIDQRDQLGSSHSSTTIVWPLLDWSRPFLSSLGCETNLLTDKRSRKLALFYIPRSISSYKVCKGALVVFLSSRLVRIALPAFYF